MAFTLRVKSVLGRSSCRIVWVGLLCLLAAALLSSHADSNANGPASGNARAYTGHQYPYGDTGSANIHPSADPDPDPSAGAGWRSRDT